MAQVVLFALFAAMSVASPAAAQDQQLVEAVERQDRVAVRTLLAASVDVNARQPDGATPLHWAAHWNDLDIATLLMQAGADVNAVNELGVTPLSLAALNASAAMTDALLRAGADPSAARPSGETVLMTGARTGNAELVRALLAAGADLQARAHFQRQTPLMWAASEGHADVVQLLLENGADLHARSKHGTTALLLAARNGDVDTARVLLGAGADVNAAEPRLAFDARIDVEESQTSGRSPLLVASASVVATSGWEYGLNVTPSTHETLAIFLLDHGADPNVADTIGRTPLHAAVETGKADLVQALLARDADPNARLIEAPFVFKGDFVSYGRYVGATPLWLAAAARVPNVDILRALATAGGDPGAAADDGTTPLMAAVGMTKIKCRTKRARPMNAKPSSSSDTWLTWTSTSMPSTGGGGPRCTVRHAWHATPSLRCSRTTAPTWISRTPAGRPPWMWAPCPGRCIPTPPVSCAASARPAGPIAPSSAKDTDQNKVTILAADASSPAALLVAYILPVCALLAPCGTGASTPRRW